LLRQRQRAQIWRAGSSEVRVAHIARASDVVLVQRQQQPL
jgi:hypothetical protein